MIWITFLSSLFLFYKKVARLQSFFAEKHFKLCSHGNIIWMQERPVSVLKKCVFEKKKRLQRVDFLIN